jgi:Tol biopolymer transport system component
MKPVTSRCAAILAVASLALLSLAAAPIASAEKEIAYRCDLDICLLDPADPGAVTNLTFNGADSYDEKPIWSPDGSKVAFVSDFTDAGHGERNVFVMSTTATGQDVNLATQITRYSSGAKAIDDLAWSPDGSRIAYTRGNNSGDDSVWVVNADGTTTFPLEIGGPGAKRHPTWSPDSSKIAYAVVKNAPEQIFIASSQGGIGPPLANGVGHEPNWSPNGSKIAFDGYHSSNFGPVDLHIVSPDGSGTPLIVPPSSNTQWTFNAWSPDSGRIAYRSEAPSGAAIYRVMNADGSGDHPLASPGEGDVRSASWSSDGSRVVYEGALIGSIGAPNLYVANTDGSGSAQPLTSDGKSFSPAWRVVASTPQAPPPHPGVEKPKVVWITKRIFGLDRREGEGLDGGRAPVPANGRRARRAETRQEETAEVGCGRQGQNGDPRRGDAQSRPAPQQDRRRSAQAAGQGDDHGEDQSQERRRSRSRHQLAHDPRRPEEKEEAEALGQRSSSSDLTSRSKGSSAARRRR